MELKCDICEAQGITKIVKSHPALDWHKKLKHSTMGIYEPPIPSDSPTPFEQSDSNQVNQLSQRIDELTVKVEEALAHPKTPDGLAEAMGKAIKKLQERLATAQQAKPAVKTKKYWPLPMDEL